MLASGLILLFLSFLPAHATLGESADSIAANKKALLAARGSVRTSLKYSIHEFQSETTTVREYVSSSGVVFGIAWNGLTHPDLAPLLGSYNPEYKKALKNAKRQPGHRHVSIITNGVVVEKWGHMRDLRGRAYAPDLIPDGVSVDEIK